MSPLRRVFHDIRTAAALAPARPAFAAGLRAAIATVAPLLAATLLGSPGGTWMSLAGFVGALADKGGPYRTRAATMGTLALAAAVAVALGTLSAGRLPIAVSLTFLVAVACSLARVWGTAGVSVGVSVLNIFVIALALPPATPHDVLTRAGFVLVGGAWAMIVSLVLWPLRPYRPVRLAVSRCYRALADYADNIARRLGDPAAHDAHVLPPGAAEVRAALEEARAALATVRRGRPGESGRGERLLVLREISDQLFGHLVALIDTIETIPAEARDEPAQRTVADSLLAVAETTRAMADAIEAEEGIPSVPVAWGGSRLRRRLDGPDSAIEAVPERARTHYLQAAVLIDRLAQYAKVGAETVATLNDGRPLPTLEDRSQIADPDDRPTFAALRALLAPDSVIVRYALRLGVVAAAAVWLTTGLGIKRGYWVTITVVIILQPYTGATSLRALQRVLGTVLGGVLTAALGALFHDPLAILPLAFVFTGVSVALLPINYAAFSVFLTPTFVLLAEASAGDWHLAGVRIVNTLIGGGLALAGARLLWPSSERSRLPAHMAAALRANRDYLRAAVRLFGDRSEQAGRALRTARRKVGMAAVNADESFERALAEHRGPPEEMTPIMTFLTYTRRLIASIAALAIARHSHEPPPAGALESFAAGAERALDDLAAAVVDRRAPAPLPSLGEAEPADDAAPPLLRARIDRIARQIRTLHDAVERMR